MWSFLLVAPALAVVVLLFVYPLIFSVITAFGTETCKFNKFDKIISGFAAPNCDVTLANLFKAWDFYKVDVAYTVIIAVLSTALIGIISLAIGGYLTLGENPRAVAVLRWLYRWPLFIPFIVAAQLMRTFLAKNGMMNNIFVSMGFFDAFDAQSFLDWRGIIATFVWKQTPFVALLVSGAMAALDRSTFEAARNLGAGRVRILVEIVTPQILQTLVVGLILSFVIMLSVLSVPLMINAQQRTMITVDMQHQVNYFGDYGVANALGIISYVMTAAVAVIYLRMSVREQAQR